MTDMPMKNGRKYVDSGFVHDMIDTVNNEHYFVRAHVWPSMKTHLTHNVVVVLSLNSVAVIHNILLFTLQSFVLGSLQSCHCCFILHPGSS